MSGIPDMTHAGRMVEGEAAFSTWFEDALNLYGWRWYHADVGYKRGRHVTPMRGHPGFPDYVAVKAGLVLFAELKSERGRISPSQLAWGADLRRAAQFSRAIIYRVFRPSDRDEITKILRGG